MFKNRVTLVVLVVCVWVFLLLLGCASTQIVDHTNSARSTNVPNNHWIFQDTNKIERDYPDRRLFKFQGDYQNLRGGRLWLQNFEASATVAREISREIDAEFTGAITGDPDGAEGDLASYAEQVVSTVSEASVPGLRREAEYWIRKRVPGERDDIFTYYVLYSIPDTIFDDLIENAFDEADQAVNLNDAQQRARDLVFDSVR